MVPIQWKVSPVIDAHSHFRGEQPFTHYLGSHTIAGHTHAVILASSGFKFFNEFKEGQACRFYVFGGLTHEKNKMAAGDGRYLGPQVAHLIAEGYHGIKMMDGAPYYKQKKILPHPLDHEYYRPFWDAAEEHAMPITMQIGRAHV